MEDSGARAEKVARLVRPNSVLHGPSFSFLFRRGRRKKVGGGGHGGLMLCDRRITLPVILLVDLMLTAVRSVMTAPGRVWGSRRDGMGYFMESVPGWHKRLSSSSLDYVDSGCVVLGLCLVRLTGRAYDLGVLISRSSREVRLLKLAIVTKIVTGKAGWVGSIKSHLGLIHAFFLSYRSWGFPRPMAGRDLTMRWCSRYIHPVQLVMPSMRSRVVCPGLYLGRGSSRAWFVGSK